jgi:hypothetical protein
MTRAGAMSVLGMIVPVAVCAVLVTQIWGALQASDRYEVAPIGDWSPQMNGDPNTPAASRNSAYPHTEQRPLFMRTRRPYEPQPPDPEPPPPPIAMPQPNLPLPQPETPAAPQLERGLKVAGVVAVGKTRSALIISASHPQGEWFIEGTAVGGWTVSEIRANTVVLKNGTQIFNLELYPER